ncbi:MAG: hypothetical protein QXS26_01370, partial [Thermosphaera sp.]
NMQKNEPMICEATYYLNGFNDHIISCGEVFVKGFVNAKLIIGRDVIIAGKGRVSFLAGENCLLIGTGNILIVENAYCINLISVGGKGHVWINEVNSRKSYLAKTHVNILNTEELWLSKLSNVKVLSKSSKIVFNSPNTYIEKILPARLDIVYTYNPYRMENNN